MGKTFNVRLEPVGIDFEVDEDETVLHGAFRQGLMLMHGCKEGQCAACKSFLLDGEVDLDKYSTFALNDMEKEEGWTLLCRAHAESDLEVELINYDEEVLRDGVALQTKQMRVDVQLNGRVLYSSTFPVCTMPRSDISVESPQKVLEFSFPGRAALFGAEFDRLEPLEIEGNIWRAGGEADALPSGPVHHGQGSCRAYIPGSNEPMGHGR